MIDIIKDIIPIREQIELYTYVRDSNFAYRFYNTHIFTEDEDPRFTHAPQQLSHQLYDCEEDKSSPHIKILRPIFDVLKNKFGNIQLLRAKVNLTFPYPPMVKYEPQMPHLDLQYDNGEPVEHKVLLYYINDSDGPTYFFNESYDIANSINPRQGVGVIFDGDQIHAASNPVFNPFRFVLNINFKLEQPKYSHDKSLKDLRNAYSQYSRD